MPDPYRLLNGTHDAATALARALYTMSRVKHPTIWVGSGYRPKDRYPDHRSRDCFDLMTGPENNDNQGDYAAGKWATDLLIAWHNQGAIKIKSMIWWTRKWKPSRGWYPYTLSPHKNHVHIWLEPTSPAISTPKPPPTKGDEEMPLTPSDITAIWDLKIDGESMRDKLYYARARSQTAADATDRLNQRLAAIESKLAALDPMAVRRAAEAGVADAIANIDVTVNTTGGAR